MIEPMNKTVLVREIEDAKTGFKIENAHHPVKGEVVAISETSSLSVGDTVYFGREYCVPVEVDGEPLVFVRELEIYAKQNVK